ncbi:MAG: low molecular weight protein arginine phosphatase [Candidatus Cohnella colombiensis]|uniref:Low molecular weight protein arginine phosphatase n=1 Tax=Candidatus Cohnella colombiensis TaxID=3121368 RepID=A0AA95EW15_9BACL|nr:MAG: low molecular weight protein arginine phosphatase [Cohnella sp.]
MKRILIVCTGNTCRSPMAEEMLRDLAARSGKLLEVRSAGVATQDGLTISAHAATTLRRRSLNASGCSTAISNREIEWAELILTLTSSHKRAIVQMYPEAIAKTYTLKEYALSGDQVMDDVAEAQRLYSEWQVRQALGQNLSPEEQARLFELQRRIPDFDIADPFGGSLAIYEQCADEIEDALLSVLERLDSE